MSVAGQSSEPDLAPHEADVLRLVRNVAAEPLGSGHANLEIRPSGPDDWPAEFTLRPTNDRACPIWIAVDIPGEAYVSLGRHWTTFELWYRNEPTMLLEELRNILQAVLAGRYEERVRIGRRRLSAKGTLHDSDPPRVIYHNVIPGLPVRRRWWWEDIAYEPYLPQRRPQADATG